MNTVREYVESRATDDVRATLRWLDETGYVLTRVGGGAEESFGNAVLVFTGGGEVTITYERGQWFLDVAPTPGAEPVQYDLLFPASEGRDYTADYTEDQTAAGTELGERSWLKQLPPGLSWSRTLPSVLEWIDGREVGPAVARVADQRYVRMWPTSHKARDIRRRWKREARAAEVGADPDPSPARPRRA